MTVLLFVLPCAGFLGWMVYRYDLYDKEPWYLLLFAMILGYVVFWGIGFVEDFSNSRLGFYQEGDHSAGQAAVAATHEELAKLLVVVSIALLFPRHFNDPIDGLIYGAFVGLGMALEESVWYVVTSRHGAPVALGADTLGPEVIRLVLHILMGGISGFGVGLVVEHSTLKHWLLILVGCVTGSMTLHFFWDYLCGIPIASGEFTSDKFLFLRVASVVLMLSAMAAFAVGVVFGSRLSQRRFATTCEPPVGTDACSVE